MREIAVLAVLIVLSGCATVMEGTGQSVSINSDPSGALCKVSREGGTLGDVSSTPGSIHIDKSKNDLSVTCQKAGFQTATIAQSPHFVGTTFGNIILGGLVGAAVDAATGADYVYPDNIHVALSPLPSSPPTAEGNLPPGSQTVKTANSGS